MTEFYETSYSNVHRGVYALGEMATAGLEGAREKVRAFVNAPSEREIIFLRNATEGLNLVAYAYGLARLKPGDVVLATQLEHHSNFVPWQYVAGRTGAEFRIIPIDDNGDLLLDEVADIENVKVVAANVVSNSLGTIGDTRRLADWAHARGAILTCDAAQAAPHVRLDVQALGADFIAVSGHKMLGPSGIGFLWGRTELLLEMEPFLLGGHMIRSVGDEKTTWGELPVEVRGGHLPGRRGRRARRRDRLPGGGRARGDRGPRAPARRLRARAARRRPGDHPLRPAARAPRGHRDVQRRGRPPA